MKNQNVENTPLNSYSNPERFWQSFLRDFTDPLTLPASTPCSSSHQTQEIRISSCKNSDLKTFIQNHKLSINTLINGALALLLSHYTRETDILFGVIKEKLDFDILPVQVSVDANASLLAWLEELERQWSILINCESTPLKQIREWSEIYPELPLFEILVIFGNYEKLECLKLTDYPLILSIDTESDLLIKSHYQQTQFADDVIMRMLEHLETLLTNIINLPEQTLAHIPLLTEKERYQLLVEWNQTQTDYPQNKCIHQLFQEQVERTPDAVAVAFENEQLTYQELNQRANQLANYLQTLGVQPEVLVGICTERSLEMIVGILGILKAGGAYVPLDITYPRERLAFMLSDSQVSILLTQQHLIAKIPEHQAKIVCLDHDWEHITKTPSDKIEKTVKTNNIAYIIYTSGSTGQPKGVLIPHSNVVRLFAATQSWFQFNHNDVWSLFHSYAFDFSVWEIWGALLYGGRLVIIPYYVSRSPELFYQLLAHEKITVLNQTPSAFQQLMQIEASLKNEHNLNLRFVIFGGEALNIQSLKPWFDTHGDKSPQLVNMYGITETTVHVTYRPINIADLSSPSKVIGCAIPDLQLYILNSQLQPVPIGVAGEIYVGGAGLARGYLKRPELTTERFISHPFNHQPDARLYKTGDLGRYLPNGDIEYLGRIDNQVKIRGFRIELGEIEAVLNQHPNLRAAKVITREDIPGDKRLVAYIIPTNSENSTSEISHQIRAYLKENLPDYMIPAAFVVLETFPLTPNGKIDHRAFPVPDFSASANNYLAPRNPTEEILVQIWSQVLKIENIGIHDNFFELGGHSLLGTQVTSRIRQVLRQEIPIRLLFEFPTIAQLSAQIGITKVTDHKLSMPAIAPRQYQENLPLSFAQQRLWFLDQLQPNSTAYNLAYTFEIQGLLNISALEQSIDQIIQRHEILRTNFVIIDGEATQIINNIDFHLPIIDVQWEAEVKKIVNQEAEKTVNLAQDFLFRITLIRLNAEKHLLLMNIHHIIFDGWSFGIFFDELKTLYTAYCEGLNSSLPQLPIQYPDFTLWQQQWLSGAILESQLNYWQQQLSGDLPLLELPTDRLRPRLQTYTGATQSFILSPELTTSITSLAQKEGVTLFMTLLTAFKVLLCRYSSQEDVIVGTPIAGRNRREIEGLMGFFVNTLVLRTDLGNNPSFRELLSRVRRVCLEAYTHQDVPFEQLVEVLQPERHLNHTPIFQVMFALQNAPMGELQLSNLTVTALKSATQTAKFDLTLSMEERNGQLIGEWEYNTDLFDDSTMERMIRNFQILLSGILANPEQNIWKLPLLTTEEKHQLLIAWNQTEVNSSQNQLIYQLFEEQVRKTPDAVAVVFENEQLTYQELNQRANQLANYLRRLGVRADKLVGLCLETSLARIVGLLGILKAGGVYLPLDPVYPQERLRFMMEDSQVSILLTQEFLAAKLSVNSLQVVNLDADWQKISNESVNNLQSCVTGENLAYVIYTSGSTGIPKGVLISHQAIAHHSQNIIEHYELKASNDRILQFASLSFDVSLEQILPTLAVGATLILVNAKLLTPWEFHQKLIDYDLTVVNIPPIYLNQWLQFLAETADANPINHLRLVICGGEALPPETLKIWKNSSLKGICLINAYGPTETTITAITFTVPPEITPIESYNNIPIGRPLPNRKVYILDQQKNPVPIGVTGELYIGGEGLGLGYLNRPELTEQKFLTNPFEDAKLYKTGDLVRYLPDGNIQFLGRIDNQVKIRGFRIELGEIEALLNKHLTIRDAKVITREDIPGDKKLVAYIIPKSGNADFIPLQSEISDQIREYLKQQLPDYMIPSAFVVLESFPLTPNGKIDYHAFPIPDFSTPQNHYIAPITPTQKILANIWSQLLKVETIGIDDNFFNLGGHSLLATMLISRIRKTFNIEIPLRLLFEFPTISQLSEHIYNTEKISDSLSLPAIEPRKQKGNIPLSFAQQRLWFLAQLEPNNIAYNMPLILRLQGSLNITALEKTISEIIQRHEILRTNFISLDGQPIQVVTDHMTFNLPIIDLQLLSDDNREIEVKKIANQEAGKPVDLVKDSLFRVKLLRLSPEEYLLLFNIHHIIFDGWSDDVLRREMAALYQAFSRGNSSPLSPLTIQYADFSLWQSDWVTGEILESQLVYWKQQLSGDLPILELPTDHPRPKMQTYQGATHSLILSSELTASIKLLSQTENVTLFMTLLAAFKILLCRYTGQNDVIVGTPIAGRNRREIEDLIGFFVNTLALRTDLSGNPSFRELLNRVRQVTLDAYAHQDLPFEKLVEELQPQRHLSHTPIFQVWFNMINLNINALELNDLKIEPITIIETTSKFDLNLYIEEKNNEIHLQFVYNNILFNADTIEWMAKHFQRLLTGLSVHPEKPISTFSLITERERYELSHFRNSHRPINSFIEFSKLEIEQSIPARFEEQVKKYPDNIAIKTKNYQWTYQELNFQANKIAKIILEESLNTQANIALLFDHDAPMIAAILGVLKAGKTYVPLDPKYPQDRVVYILEDSLVQVVLTNHKNLLLAQELIQGKLPIINIDEINISGSAIEINQPISPDTLAYILYTSGSTGKPKGVIQNHRNVLHFIRNYTNNLHISQNDNLSLFASYSFDAAVIDIFSAILNGATLYPFDIKAEGLADLATWLEIEKITIYHSTPTVYRSFIQILSEKQSREKIQLSQVRLVVLGGEQAIKSDVELYQKYFDDECIFVNGLGSTESSFNLQYLIDKNTQITQQYVPVGYAFEDTEILLLDDEGKQTDIYGEIAIRSPHVALGYWQKPELTKAVFLDDTHGNKRIYRTGDLGRLTANGAIECLGRKDFQVKIRGFRIELGEVEAVLKQHPDVKETVVVAREDIPGEKRLVAYIIPSTNIDVFISHQSSIINEIKHYLQEQLPDYMVPAAFVMLDVMPLTPNGKINRLALPAPDLTSLATEKYVTSSDNLELQLTKIWENVLGVRPIGLNDNFFDVGGHSLLAVKLFAQIEKIFGKNIALTTLFQTPTIKQLANVLRDEGYSSSWSSLVPIQPHGSKRPFFYIHTIYGGLIYSLNLLSKLDADQPVYGLQAQGLDGKNPHHTCIEDMASHYIKEIQTIQPHGPYILGGWCAGGMIAYEIGQQLYAQGETVELLTIFDAYPPKMIPPSDQVVNSLSIRKANSRIYESISYVMDMIKRNRSYFANLTLQQQIIAIWGNINRRIEDKIKEIVYQFYVQRNLPLPHRLRHLVVRDAIAQAYKNYCPTVYPGQVIFFRAVDQSQEYARYLKRWEELAAGGLEIHDIPGNHDSIMAEPHVSVLAEKLRRCFHT
ncbi:amino acid adenylation domain-containing protein [Anabaena cylindrica UHCC 0172]|uniref:non-ribosomal peptide synthetase n=1 Tax=Anabaena cylindrica TaxID=1165 RepID=UPI002B1EB537|nr:non-ribosomal peptide synthetase [Anabaena cylindrica]MEA5552827.1 amino acid adenylation domain-containing protein [Anabaena cylindrica UHCC 0172]